MIEIGDGKGDFPITPHGQDDDSMNNSIAL